MGNNYKINFVCIERCKYKRKYMFLTKCYSKSDFDITL